jgi:hypothetical protein
MGKEGYIMANGDAEIGRIKTMKPRLGLDDQAEEE